MLKKRIYILIIAVRDASMIYREKVPKLNLLYFTVSKDPYDKLRGRFTHRSAVHYTKFEGQSYCYP